jgi:AraC-like DNA-binding protein
MINLLEPAAVLSPSVAETRNQSGNAVTVLPNYPGDNAHAVPARVLSSPAGRLAATLQYMLAHLDQPMDIATLSANAGFSRSRFFELFKSATGDTPINWFIKARMQWASDLLVRTEMRIKQIAWHVGYEDQFYFSRLFKSVHGVSPSQYRARRVHGVSNGPALSSRTGLAREVSVPAPTAELLGTECRH